MYESARRAIEHRIALSCIPVMQKRARGARARRIARWYRSAAGASSTRLTLSVISLHVQKHNLRAILACVQATGSTAATAEANQGATTDLARDLYAVVVYLHKNCNSDLFEAVGALELTLTQIKLLHHLEDATTELTVKEAAEHVLISLPAMSRTVDDLVRRGFVARHEDLEDRRMKRVSLTEAGRSVIRRLNAARLNGLREFTQTLTDSERELLAGALAALLERADVGACYP